MSDDGSTTNTITDFFGYRLAVTTLVATNGWSGTITPSTTDGTAGGFVPPVRTYAHVTSNLVAQDFTWIPPPIISGKVTRGGASTGVASVTLVLSNGSLTVETMTDAQGNYSITLPRGWTGTVTTVTPSTNGLTGAFAPTYLAYTNICANRTAQNFSYGALPVVKGKVTKAGTTNGVGGVTITFSNNVSTITITTDGNGSYSNTVPYRWSGKATASFTSGGFAMPTITYSALTANQTGKDYIWTPAPMISGKVTKSGTSAVVTNIVITFVGNGTTNTATTDGKGTYSNVVVYGWTGTVTPSNVAGCGFSPVSKSYSKLTANSAGQNFTWLPPPIISGKVTQSGTGMTGVTITASNGGGTNTTGVGGTYSLAVPYNWTGVVTCASTRVGTFSPTSKSFKTKVTANQTQNFTWTASPAPHAVSPSVSATIVLPRQLLHATGRVRWTGADAVQVRQSPELLTIALVDGVVAAEPAVPVVAPGDLTTALEFADGLAGIVGTANCKLVVVRNVNGQPMTDATLTDTSVIDTVLFLTPGHDAILSWDLLLLRP